MGGEGPRRRLAPDRRVPHPTPMKKNWLRRASNRVLHLVARNCPGGLTLRPFLHRLRGVKIGKHVFIGDDVYLENEYPELVEIQDGSVLSIRCVIIAHTNGGGLVTIGRNVWVGPGVQVVCPVGKTLKIGDGALISTGSVVSASVAPQMLIAPPRSVPVGRVTVSLTEPGSWERFIAGMQPLSTAKTTRAKAAEPPAASSQ
jgi:acetyltransferase-like isoleucine patch superfamily enzyme